MSPPGTYHRQRVASGGELGRKHRRRVGKPAFNTFSVLSAAFNTAAFQAVFNDFHNSKKNVATDIDTRTYRSYIIYVKATPPRRTRTRRMR